MTAIIDISPGSKHQTITPSDVNLMAENFRSIIVSGGNVAIEDTNGVVCIYQNFSGVLPFMPTRVLATGTTATNIIGIY